MNPESNVETAYLKFGVGRSRPAELWRREGACWTHVGGYHLPASTSQWCEER